MNMPFRNCMLVVHAINMPMNIFEDHSDHSTMIITVFIMSFENNLPKLCWEMVLVVVYTWFRMLS